MMSASLSLPELFVSLESTPLDLPEDTPRHQAVRLELICRIRRMIDSGQYDNDHRLQAALDRLLDDMM